MNKIAFLIDLKNCEKILSDLGLLKKTNIRNINVNTYKKYSEEFRSSARKDNYAETYVIGAERDDYDYLLFDDSFFQFSFDENDGDFIIRMAFYPTINKLTYEEFIYEMFGDLRKDVNMDEFRTLFIDEYQQFLDEQEINTVTPIRYDYNSSLYRKIVHSVSHLHFGFEENIRVPTNKVLHPRAFVKMILQYYYYDGWKRKVELEEWENSIIEKSERNDIDGKYWTNDDQKLPFIKL